MNLFRAAFLLAATAACCPACTMHLPPGEDDFSFRPDSSKTYTITLLKQKEDSGTYNGKPFKYILREKAGMQLRLIRREDTLYHMQCRFTCYKEVRADSVAIEKDTAVYEPMPSAEEIKRNANREIQSWYVLAAGVPMDVWMNGRGEAVRAAGYDRIVDSVVARSHADRRTVAYVLREKLGETAVQDYLNEVFAFVPARPVDTGKSWVVDQTLVNLAPVLLSNVYVLKQRGGDTALLGVTTYLSARRSAQGLLYMKGKQTGRLTASYATGIPYEYRAEGGTLVQTDKYERPAKRAVYVVVR